MIFVPEGGNGSRRPSYDVGYPEVPFWRGYYKKRRRLFGGVVNMGVFCWFKSDHAHQYLNIESLFLRC